jgi:hypothetical protein
LKDLIEVSNSCPRWLEARYCVTPGHDGELFLKLSREGDASLVALESNVLY